MVSGEELYQVVKDLCTFGYRRAGTQPAKEAEKYIYNKLKDVGLPEVRLEPFTFTRWWAEKYELKVLSSGTPRVPSDQQIDSFPVWFSGSTGPDGIDAEVVYVGYGTPADFEAVDVKGKIVLIDNKMILNFHPTFAVFGSLSLAKSKGALGAIIISGAPLDAIPYIFLWEGVEGWRDRLPALMINNDDGNYLKSLCSKKLTVRLVEDVRTEDASSDIVIGELPGMSEETILIGTHTDSTFAGAIDNASGNAGLIGLAKHYAKIPRSERGKTMVFAGWTGHEAAFLGVNKFVQMNKDILGRTSVFVMLDGFGSKGYYNQADGGVVETGTDEKRGLFISDNPVLIPPVIEAALKYKLLPAAYVSARALPVSDLGPFIMAGVPSIMIIGKPVWYHTIYDTIDKLTPEHLEKSLKAHIHVINRLHVTSASEIKEADGKLRDIKEFIVKRPTATPPSVHFTVTPNPVQEWCPAIFHVTVLTAPESVVLEVEWDFGDGTTSTSLIGIHAYEKPGTYQATLKVTDSNGNVATAKRIVRVTKIK